MTVFEIRLLVMGALGLGVLVGLPGGVAFPQVAQQQASTEIVPLDVTRAAFAPSGWMGDGEKRGGFATVLSPENPHRGASSQRWIYHPQGAGWGAVAYQYPAGNWGDKKGKNLSGKGYRELSVWARGVADKHGHYPVIQFKAGGNTDPSKTNQASFEAEGEPVTLTVEWKRYTVSLAGQDLSEVISAFCFVLRADDNPDGATFFLSEVEYR